MLTAVFGGMSILGLALAIVGCVTLYRRSSEQGSRSQDHAEDPHVRKPKLREGKSRRRSGKQGRGKHVKLRSVEEGEEEEVHMVEVEVHEVEEAAQQTVAQDTANGEVDEEAVAAANDDIPPDDAAGVALAHEIALQSMHVDDEVLPAQHAHDDCVPLEHVAERELLEGMVLHGPAQSSTAEEHSAPKGVESR